jgi:hypothetical protein
MTRFFFDTHDGVRAERDTDGVDLPNEETARSEAKAALTDMARDHLPNGNHLELRVTIRDEAGEEIYTASLVLDVSMPHARRRRPDS